MDCDVNMVECEDQEIYGRTYESQTAISAVKAYIWITKKKPQHVKFWDYELERLTTFQQPIKRPILPVA